MNVVAQSYHDKDKVKKPNKMNVRSNVLLYKFYTREAVNLGWETWSGCIQIKVRSIVPVMTKCLVSIAWSNASEVNWDQCWTISMYTIWFLQHLLGKITGIKKTPCSDAAQTTISYFISAIPA